MSEVQKSKSVPKPVLGCFGLMGGMFLLVVIIAAVNSKPPSERANSAGAGAVVACRNAVRERLKAPASADFQSVLDGAAATNLGDGKYRVDSYVDAQNSFGAKIRTRFGCSVATKDGENFTVTNLEMH